MACEVCGSASQLLEWGCRNCGYPAIPADTAWALVEAKGALLERKIPEAIQQARLVRKAAPSHFLPALVLAEAYRAQARRGEKGLEILSEKEWGEALKLVPASKEAHVVLLEHAARLSRLDVVLAKYGNEWSGLPFAADLAAISDSFKSAAVETDDSGGGWHRSPLVIGLAVLAVALIVWFAVFRRGSSGGGGLSGFFPTGSYAAGTNLAKNGDFSDGNASWNSCGPVKVETEGNPCVRFDGSADASFRQTMTLPKDKPRFLLVVARARASTIPGDGMSGLPYLWGSIQDGKGGVLQWLQGYAMMFRGTAGEWSTIWGSFELPPESAGLEVSFQQGLQAGGSRQGVIADVDDLGVYLFNSPITARTYAEAYTGEPPTAEFLASDPAPIAVSSETPSPAPGMSSTEKGKNFVEAKAMYDRISVGMSQDETGIIMGFDAKTRAWSKDFGWSMKPECVTLNVFFVDGRVGRVVLTKDYESPPYRHPGRILMEKGDPNLN